MVSERLRKNDFAEYCFHVTFRIVMKFNAFLFPNRPLAKRLYNDSAQAVIF
jgi:hypothetical protein